MANEGTDEKHHKYRCRDLRRQLDELEEYNDMLAVKLQRAQKRLKRMKVERNILLERFAHTQQYKPDESSDSDVPLKKTFPRAASDDDTARVRRRNGHSSAASTPRQQSLATNDAAPARKPRAEKDPNAPKRPANAFVLYCQVERPNIKSAGTELSSSELTRSMGVKWRGLPKSDKQKYYDLYEREMARYQREMDSYKGAAAKPDALHSSPPPPTAAMDVDASSPEADAPAANGAADTDPASDAVTPTTATEREEPAKLPGMASPAAEVLNHS
ncbi:non-histone protein [Coemansia sp. RSA 2706]|nr:non-histone protein [Coemansia sp. RSA 2711]KAJ2301899.1 non-histone protein [Coemansia sp. RSA 2706]KAJ2327852.1 non-histone protein [Coemansia sp. RSA 2702]KAJ2366196.1 non-histone protein [Coemansia sp. RSA 2610]KAJ2732137.1 non-histone protein [Coemansia sp. Cherry 401B]